MQGLRVLDPSDADIAVAAYGAARQSGEPTFAELQQAGWFRVVWGRIIVPLSLAQRAKALPREGMAAFVSFLDRRYQQAFSFDPPPPLGDGLDEIRTAITIGEREPRNLRSEDPGWVAARLWERSLSTSSNQPLALRDWVDRMDDLGHPDLVPSRAWGAAKGMEVLEAAVSFLEQEPSLAGWEQEHELRIKQLALAYGREPSEVSGSIANIPNTELDRAFWLEDEHYDMLVGHVFDNFSRMAALLGMFATQISQEHHVSGLRELTTRLLTICIARPALMRLLFIYCQQQPTVLVELLMFPPTAALACALVAEWQFAPSPWERAINDRDDAATRSFAFADAVSIAAEYLADGSLPAVEIASLLRRFYERVGARYIDDGGAAGPFLAKLRDELCVQTSGKLTEITTALFDLEDARSAGRPGPAAFAAALDVIELGSLGSAIDPAPWVSAYVQALSIADSGLLVNCIGTRQAAALVRIALQCKEELKIQFFKPIDVQARLAAREIDNPYILVDTIAQSLRAHIRILSRAIAAWAGDVPDALIDALISATRAGAIDHERRGMVDAFAPRHQVQSFRGAVDRPIALDLGAALGTLAQPMRDRLLAAVLETDEPMILAELLPSAPRSTVERIRQRIAVLNPDNSGQLRSIIEVRARIDALLNAGLSDAASLFIDNERTLETLGKGSRRLARLQTSLRLHVSRQEWAAIIDMPFAPDLPQADQEAATELLTFYKGVAHLASPEGNPDAAVNVFMGLLNRHSTNPVYVTNLFIARVNRLLIGDVFQILPESRLPDARRALQELEQMLVRVRAGPNHDQSALHCNKALLLLAMGEPNKAVELLAPADGREIRGTAAAYLAVAYARTERPAEAQGLLAEAGRDEGNADLVVAAQAQIESRTPFALPVWTGVEDTTSDRIRNALFSLWQMDHVKQTETLHPGPESFDNYVTYQIRAAGASIQSLVPMMTVIDFTESEDDLSALVRELLIARFEFLKWSVPDQSKGGFTTRHNPGERDLLIQKGSFTLAVAEAVVSKHAIGQLNLTTHFQKLVRYSTCRLFFYLAYVYLETPSGVIKHLRQCAENQAPAGYTFCEIQDIPLADSGPYGFNARYMRDGVEIKIVFLVLDLGQSLQRGTPQPSA
jgi:hypothetical protein